MPIDIRPPARSEMPAYYMALPFGNGLPHWEPAPAAWHGGSEPWPPPRRPATSEQLDSWAEKDLQDDTFHPIAAFVDGKLVGASAMLSFEITVPGIRPVPMGGVTSTGVIATHRRMGLLRSMMQAMFEAALERGQPLATLSASEGGIYGRFGFSPATLRTRWEIERAQAALVDRGEEPTGTLELVDASVARKEWPILYDEVRRSRVGELSAPTGKWDDLSDTAQGTDGPVRYLVHRDEVGRVDGIANFRLPWSHTTEHVGTLVVEALQASNPAAYRALWELLLDFDLTRTVVAHTRPSDEPLRWMLANPRAMRITRQSDNLWVRLLDVPAALEARTFDSSAAITFEVPSDRMCPANVGTWRLDAGPEGATCSRSSDAPDLVLDIQALGSLYLGGMSAQLLAGAGRIRPRDTGAVARLSRIFRIDPAPHNSFAF